MKSTKYTYLCKSMSNLTGLPIRLYENEKLKFMMSPFEIIYDPIKLCLDKAFMIDKSVDCFVEDDLNYYVVLVYKNTRIVLGPSKKDPYNESEIRELAFKLKIPQDDFIKFKFQMSCFTPLPLESMLQAFYTLNYVISGEELTLESEKISSAYQKTLTQDKEIEDSQNIMKDFSSSEKEQFNNTFMMEQTIVQYVVNGDVYHLKEWVNTAPASNEGKLSSNLLRHAKNIFIVVATIVSRAAIEGGIEYCDSYALSDYYIQKAELLTSISEITNLQYHMILDFTTKVSNNKSEFLQTRLITKAKSLIDKNISRFMTTDELADSLNVSRSTISTRFKKETGMNISTYIQKNKIEAAKKLIDFSDQSLSDISIYLGFSSQSHFNRVFKAQTNMTPLEYKKSLNKRLDK